MDDKELNIDEISNYSKHNGTMVDKVQSKDFTIENTKHDNCEICGFENVGSNIYCKSCGSELYTVKDNKYIRETKYNIKPIVKTAVVSVVLLLIVSIFYKALIFMKGSEINELINPLHILLAINIGKINVFTTSMYSANSITIQIGMVVMAILPIVALGFSNIVFMNTSNRNIKSITIDSILVGVVYGSILGFLSIFTKNRINTSEMYMYTGGLIYGFTLISSLINGFILGFISTFIVGIFRNKDTNININIIKLALKTIVLGIACMLLILSIVSVFNSSFIHDLGLFNYVNRFSLGVILIQLAVYLWAFANLIPVVVGNISLSILGISSANLFSDTKLLLIALIFISMLILIVVGNKIRIKFGENNIHLIKQFSMSYAIIMGVLSLLTKILVYGNNNYSLEMGFGIFISVVISYVYSYIVTSIAFKLS